MDTPLYSPSSNLAAIRSFYESGMATEIADVMIADDLVLDATPGFPLAGRYQGWANVTSQFFGALAQRVSLSPVVESVYAQGDHVLVVGHYAATTTGGREAGIRFVHDWSFANGRAVHMRQTADSAIARDLYDD